MRPAGYRVMVRPDEVEEQTGGGIFIPSDHREKEQQAITSGKLVAVGEFAWADSPGPWAVPGDRVLFKKFAGHVLTKDDVVYRIINDEDIVGVE